MDSYSQGCWRGCGPMRWPPEVVRPTGWHWMVGRGGCRVSTPWAGGGEGRRGRETRRRERLHLYEVSSLQGALGLPQPDHRGGGPQPGDKDHQLWSHYETRKLQSFVPLPALAQSSLYLSTQPQPTCPDCWSGWRPGERRLPTSPTSLHSSSHCAIAHNERACWKRVHSVVSESLRPEILL